MSLCHEKINRYFWLMLGFIALAAMVFTPDAFALADGDKLDALNDVVTTGEKAVKTFCYIIGCASVGVGGYRFVQSQSLSAAATSAVISIAAFKAPGMLIATAII